MGSADVVGAVDVVLDKAMSHAVESTSATVVFTPSGLRGQFSIGTTVLQAAQSLGVDLESSCGGRGLCGRCQVSPGEGEFPKHGISAKASHLSQVGAAETRSAKILKLSADRRLGCSAQILGDMVIDVPAESQLHQQHITKEAQQIDIELNPMVKLYVVSVEEPDMHNPASDFRRLQQALAIEHQLQTEDCDLLLLKKIQDVLRKGNWIVTVAVYDDRLIQDVWPGYKETVYGLVVDLGSTTLAAHLCDLSNGDVVASAAQMNPQIRFGEDLMSRVSYVMMNEGGDVQMTNAVRQSFNELAQSACQKANVELDDVMEMTVVANPVMHHLFLGIDPTPLGSAPFALATEASMTLKATELDIQLNPQARIFILPCIAGHIGADTAGMILAEKPYLSEEIVLLVDVGTNAEIVLGNKDRLLAASSPTGPAFEGAQISCGQRAAKGAIERVRIDPDTLQAKFKVIGSDLWSDEEGFDDVIKTVGVTGVCGSGIIEVVAEMYLHRIITVDGVVNGDMAKTHDNIIADGRTYSYVLYSGDNIILKITQNDVRAIQLAKAALYAGIKLLMENLGITSPDKIGIAGAFGSHIDSKYAVVLGLIPDCELSAVNSVGNAAGTGARIALLDKVARSSIEQQLMRVEKIETAIEPAFQQHFVEAMAFPHKTDSFAKLREVVQLPEIFQVTGAEVSGGARRGGVRRRRVKRSAAE